MMYKNWGNFFFLKKKYFRFVELGPKFGICTFSAIFALFFRVPKNLIYINNAFNGYRYLKSTRKELSGGTLMLKKEYCLDRWNCDWKSYTFPKKYPPARENDQNSTKSTKWLKITLRGSKMVPIFGTPKIAKNTQNDPFSMFWGYRIWHFGCPNQNSKTTFQYKYPPKTPI